MTIPIAKDGLPFIIVPLILSITFYFLGIKILSLIFFILMLFMLWFFRDPNREIIQEPTVILSPADGKIIEISDPYEDKVFPDEKNIRISIFMSPMDAHINRAPISGKITLSKYNKGKFFPAYKPKASLENEQHWLSIENEKIKINLKLIAGIMARRVKCMVKEGDYVVQGQKIAIIKFGSRVDIFIPPKLKILVSTNEKVFAGISKLASFKEL